MKRTLLALSTVFAVCLALPAKTQAQARSVPVREIVVTVLAPPGDSPSASISYEDGSSPRSFVRTAEGVYRLWAPVPPGSRPANIVVRDPASTEDYDDTVVVDLGRTEPGALVNIRLDRRLPIACSRHSFDKLKGSPPDVERLIARYLAVRRIRYLNRCLYKEAQLGLAETWYRLSLRVHRKSAVFSIDPNAADELRALSPQIYQAVRKEELA